MTLVWSSFHLLSPVSRQDLRARVNVQVISRTHQVTKWDFYIRARQIRWLEDTGRSAFQSFESLQPGLPKKPVARICHRAVFRVLSPEGCYCSWVLPSLCASKILSDEVIEIGAPVFDELSNLHVWEFLPFCTLPDG